MNRQALGIILAALAALGSHWLARQWRSEAPPAERVARHDPDTFVENLVLTRHDATGRPTHRLWASRLLHYPDDDTAELAAPRLALYAQDQPTWTLTSEQAWIATGGAELHLLGAVHIERPAGAGRPATQIDTRDVLVRPDSRYAETREPVHYRAGGTAIDARGMRAWFDDRQYELLAEVRGVHHPAAGP